MTDKVQKGITGEALVAHYLIQQGYRLVARNYHSRHGEIDLIAENGTFLAFVEVKTRRGQRFSAPREAVTTAKQRRIRQTALIYLQNCPTDLQPRFDVAEVYLRNGVPSEVVYFEDAFI